MEKTNMNNTLDGIYDVVDRIEKQGNGMVVVGAWFNGGASPMPVNEVPTADMNKVCMFGAVPATVYDGNKYKAPSNLVGYPVQWFSVSEYSGKSKPKVEDGSGYMTTEEAVDHICCLLNLMTLPDIIPDGTTVYNTDTGEMEELAPMIREANEELHWLMNRAKIGDAKHKDNQPAANVGNSGTFMSDFVLHINEVNGAMTEFIKWFDREAGKATAEDIEEVLNCGNPAIGDAERRLLEGALSYKRVEKLISKPGAKATVIHICHK